MAAFSTRRAPLTYGTVVAAVVVLQFGTLASHPTGLFAASGALVTVTAHGWAGSLAGSTDVLATGALATLGLAKCLRDRRNRVLREHVGGYALGCLPADERPVAEAHLLACTSCREELADLTPVAGLLGRTDRNRVVAFFIDHAEITNE